MILSGIPIRDRIAKETETVHTSIDLLYRLFSGMADAAELEDPEEAMARIGRHATDSTRSLLFLTELPDSNAALKEHTDNCKDLCERLSVACRNAGTVEDIQEILLAYGEQLQLLSAQAEEFLTHLGTAAGGRMYMELEALTAAAKQLKKMGLTRILDCGCALDEAEVIGRNLAGQYTFEELLIDGLTDAPESVTPCMIPNLYEHVYSGNDPLPDFYDAVLIMNRYDGSNVAELIEQLHRFERCALYSIFNLLPNNRGDFAELREALSVFPRYMTVAEREHILVIVDNTAGIYNDQAAIYAVTHKPFNCPAYPMYHPIHAGSIDKESLGYPGDHTGDNISRLNPYINECTALYWMWKNDRHPIVGLNHYRRFFAPKGMDNANDWLLTETVLSDIMKRCDIILANVAYCYPMTIEQHLQDMFDHSRASMEGPEIVRTVLSKRQPDYVKYYDRVMQGHTFYLCNLFITTHEILDAYCTWLFCFLPEATEEVNRAMGADGFRDIKDMRIVGFVAERLLTVWLLGEHLKIECLPIVNGGNL